jgi:glycosyltransferase involved in cell wall biosynthesis
MKTILYIGNFSFPLGNAAGKRVYANGKILKELGYQVIFVGMNKDISPLSSLKTTKNIFDGFIYYNLPYPQKNLDWLNYRSTFNKFVEFLKEETIIEDLELIIYYGSPTISFFNTKLIRFCNQKDIKVVTDCVDWLTAKTNNPLFNMVKWSDNLYQKAYANKKADGVIAISRYLADYYEQSGCTTVIIPPLSPIKYEITEGDFNVQEKKIITYAGQPFRIGQKITDCSTLKDRIDKTIVLLHHMKEKGCKFIFNIYGFTKDEYLYSLPFHRKFIDDLGDSICFHGLTRNEEVVDSIIKSDFTILIRDINRDTTAGFPTKVSESISCGTPVITTRTSDLEDYITEGENGFFIDNDTEKVEVQLKNILNIDKSDITRMKNNCINSNVFSWGNFIDNSIMFLEKLKISTNI